jgi:hypothetical protein
MFNYYTARMQDIVRILQPRFDNGGLIIDAKGKIHINNVFPTGKNWFRSSKKTMGKHCSYLWGICFQEFGFVHSQCQNCYKVVANIKTLEDLMKTKDVQKEMDVASKAGIDDRAYTKGQYGAYWYAEGFEGGLQKLEEVREAMKDIDADIFLKRGCTEYENRFGDSAYWEKLPMELAAEKRIDSLFDLGDFYHEQPDWVGDHVLTKWIEFAHSRGDMTYLKYTDGMPLFPAYRTYEPGDKSPNELLTERKEELLKLRQERDVQTQEQK